MIKWGLRVSVDLAMQGVLVLVPKSFLGVVAGVSEARWRENRSMDRGERKRKKTQFLHG